MTWQGWDGSLWSLAGDRASDVYLRPGVRGVDLTPHDRFTDSSPAVPGSRWRGSRATEREVFWPITVRDADTPQAWIERDRAFWRTMHPDRPGVWTVTQPDGAARALRCRFVSCDTPLTHDPARRGSAQYGIYLVAEDAHWAGQLISRAFESSDPLDFLPSTGGPPFRISEGSLSVTANIANPGDVPAAVEWWLTDAESAVVGVGDRVAVVPFPIEEGRMLVIDTRPTARSAIEIDRPPLDPDGQPLPLEAQQEWVAAALPSGVDRTRELGAASKLNGRVPPAQAAELAISLVGVGAQVRATIVPQYFRAW